MPPFGWHLSICWFNQQCDRKVGKHEIKMYGWKHRGVWYRKHFKSGCSAKVDNLKNVRNTLLEHFDTTSEKLKAANHKPGPGCRCIECNQLKNIEDKWIFRMGTMYGKFGLNNRNEVTNKVRAGF